MAGGRPVHGLPRHRGGLRRDAPRGTVAALVGAILVPVVAFVVAARATRGRPIAARVLVMLAGLAAASALTVGLATLVPML
ncbi:hypothetical protein [Clavibacter tessellarius]|uniref:hypothetical protein n=1 Tax=Clavibacter tessellarius TaxID=31965 RepID=UPI0032487AF5